MKWALSIAAFLLSFKTVTDLDFWWHLSAGRWLWANFKPITADPFSFTFLGQPWTSITWGYELILYACKQLSGDSYFFVNIFHSLLAAGSIFVCWLIYELISKADEKPISVGRYAAFLLVLAALIPIDMRWNHRPEMMTHFFCVTIFYFLLRSWQNEQSARIDKFIILAWVLIFFWVNSHGIFAFGAYLFVLFFLAESWRRFVAGEKIFVKENKFLIAALGAGFICLLNPRGLHGAFFPIHLLKLMNTPFYQRTIPEGTNPLRDSVWGFDTWCLVIWSFVVLIDLIFTIKNKKLSLSKTRFTWVYLPTALALIWISISARRNIAILILWTLPFVAYFFSRGLEKISEKFKSLGLDENFMKPVVGLIYTVFILATVTSLIRPAFANSRFGNGISFTEYPTGVMEFLKKHKGQSWKIFGNVELNDFMLFQLPGFQPYIDGRFAEVYSQKHFQRYMDILAHPFLIEDEAKRWKLQAMASTYEPPLIKHVIQYLDKSSSWKLAYLDHTGVVFIHVDHLDLVPEMQTDYQKYRHKIFEDAQVFAEEDRKNFSDKYYNALSLRWKKLDQWQASLQLVEGMLLVGETDRANDYIQKLAQQPDVGDALLSSMCLTKYMYVESKARVSDPRTLGQDIGAAEDACFRAVQKAPTDISVQQTLGLLFMNTGRLDQAIAQFKLVLKYDPISYETHLVIASTYGQMGNYTFAQIHYSEAARLRPADPTAYLEFANLAERANRKSDAIEAYERAYQVNGDPQVARRIEMLKAK